MSKKNKLTDSDFLVTGIGASAGGIQALQTFFQHTNPSSGIAYVVILHLSPDHDSKLAEILRLCTPMPVAQVTEETKILPDHVYVVPPNKSLFMYEDRITVSDVETIEERRAPVDIFFRSLAESHGPRAVGVILSGTGANGSMGIKRIKENGGVAFVQSPREAEFNEMPRNGIATELIDAVMTVAEIPPKILEYKNSLGKLDIVAAEDNETLQQEGLRNIFMELRARTGHDFSNYKKATVLRRLERRMNVRNISDLQSYSLFLKNEAEESTALLKDLLISVTNFFRDKNPFRYLEDHVIPLMLKDKGASDFLRIWVAGCATGEEAYSIAMLVAEQIGNLPETPIVQIFATDIDEHAIAVAREGLYTINDAADVSPERLRRFFVKEGNEYRVRRELREMILFAHHNLIKDPPFSHLDLATCRNMLIYLNNAAQKRVMETLHFALNPGGFLFIGSSESVEGSSDLFVNVKKEFHIYQSRAVMSRPYPLHESSQSAKFRGAAPDMPVSSKKAGAERITFGELHQQLLEQYAAPSIVVNEEFDIVHLSENAGKFLELKGGEPTSNLLDLVRPDLRLELRGGLYQAVQQKINLKLTTLNFATDEPGGQVIVHIRPVLKSNDVARGFILIIFETIAGSRRADIVQAGVPDAVAQRLEDELLRSKSQLRSSVEQYEVQAEELKASNEELQAMNEELRSAAEELETSKEELQSINEELLTVNQELKVKIDELSHANDDFRNLMNSTNIGTIFLDRGLKVNAFTPAIRQVFNLIPNDIGRSLSDLSSKLSNADLIRDAELVLEKLSIIEREVITNDQQHFMMRLSPYRTAEEHISGVVVTFVDITRLKLAEATLRQIELEQRFLLELDARLLEMDAPEIITQTALQALGTQLGAVETDFVPLEAGLINSKSIAWSQYLPASDEPRVVRAQALVEEGEHELVIPCNEAGQLQAHFVLRKAPGSKWAVNEKQLAHEAVSRTWTRMRKAIDQAGMQRSDERVRIILASVSDFSIVTVSPAGILTSWNPGSEKMFGYTETEALGKEFGLLFTPEDRLENVPALEIEKALQEGRAEDERWHIKKDGTRFYASGVTTQLKYSNEGVVKIARDLTQQKLIEQQKDQFIGIASHELKTPVTSIKAYAEVLQDMFLSAGDKASAELMGRLDSQVDRLTTLISHLLDTTKIAEGQLNFFPEQFDISTLIEDQLIDVQRTTKKHQLTLTVSGPQSVFADKERIGQVVMNLLTNAIKYSPNGGDILITSVAEEDAMLIGVTDQGIGISADSTERIFNRFFRTDDPRILTFPGLGLGLFISSEIVKRHGGSIWVNSTPGKGSAFFFRLPLKSRQDAS